MNALVEGSMDEFETTIFSGRKFTPTQLREVISTIRFLGNLSRNELALTLCEHLAWKTPTGTLKVNSCMSMLEKLKKLGLVDLPVKKKRSKNQKRPPDKVIKAIDDTALQLPFADLGKVDLKLARTKSDIEEWNTLVNAHHYLGYQRPVGNALRYFVVANDKAERKLGCIMFTSASAFALECRDKWIGWSENKKNRRLHLIISNSRFLIFPWVNVKNLASHTLALSLNRIQSDWLTMFATKPVLVETYVDPALYFGTCYKASNWTFIGTTKGRGRSGAVGSTSKKDVYVFPLAIDFRRKLLGRKKKTASPAPVQVEADDYFVNQWSNFIAQISSIAIQYDKKWQVRKRIIDSMLLVLLILRLVYSKNNQSYGSTIQELWDNSQKMQGYLPQERAISASSFSEARPKLDETIFKDINEKLISSYNGPSNKDFLWNGHRLFGVDGSKVNLPRSLVRDGFRMPSFTAHRPMGLISCLYNLESKIPYDFDLFDHDNERQAALSHLKKLKSRDIVIYDRGYFSYGLLWNHLKTGIYPVFRLSTNLGVQFDEFIESQDKERIVDYKPSKTGNAKTRENYGVVEIVPIKVRLIRYETKEKEFYLATTIMDSRYQAKDFANLYGKRWQIEEGYKTGKQMIGFEEFHSKSLRGVKQEIFAHFVLISMSRLFSNYAEGKRNPEGKDFSKTSLPTFLSNQKSLFNAMLRNLEGLFLENVNKVKVVVSRVVKEAARYMQRQRPNRSFERRSFKPLGKWSPGHR